jgi:plasmid rolling circle replication initiator protein Rep
MYKDAKILSKKLLNEKKKEIVKYLSSAIHGRRLYAYGGIMRKIASDLKIKDIDKTNFIDINDKCEMDESLAKMILIYRWNMGVSNYILENRIELKRTGTAVTQAHYQY